MIGLQNSSRQNAPLAWRLKIDDLAAQLAPLDRYGVTGLSSALTNGIGALARGWRKALRLVVCCAEGGDPDCETV